MGVTGLDHPPRDRLGDDIARSQVGQLVDALHEPVAVPVDEERTLAADRLGDQRLLPARVRAQPHHGGVELHELQVAQHRAGAVGDGHPVAGRHRGVRGLREDLPEAAAGQDHGPAPNGTHAVALALAHHVEGDAGDAAVLGRQQVDGQGVLDDLDLGSARDGGEEGALDLGAGGVPSRVGDPVTVVAALAGQAELTVGVQVEVGAEGDQLADGLRPLGHEHPDRLRVAGAGTGDQGVLLVLRRGVPRAEGGCDAALAPTASSLRRARPWSPRAPCRRCRADAARRSGRRCRSRSPRRRR